MERIVCERDTCDQLLTPEDTRCERCGRKQTTKGWTLLQLFVMYPVAVMVFGFAGFLVIGMVLPARLSETGPLPIILGTLAMYLYLGGSTVRAYRRRQKRIERTDLETLPELE